MLRFDGHPGATKSFSDNNSKWIWYLSNLLLNRKWMKDIKNSDKRIWIRNKKRKHTEMNEKSDKKIKCQEINEKHMK